MPRRKQQAPKRATGVQPPTQPLWWLGEPVKKSPVTSSPAPPFIRGSEGALADAAKQPPNFSTSHTVDSPPFDAKEDYGGGAVATSTTGPASKEADMSMTATTAAAEVAIELPGKEKDPELEQSCNGAATAEATGTTAATSMAGAISMAAATDSAEVEIELLGQEKDPELISRAVVPVQSTPPRRLPHLQPQEWFQARSK